MTEDRISKETRIRALIALVNHETSIYESENRASVNNGGMPIYRDLSDSYYKLYEETK